MARMNNLNLIFSIRIFQCFTNLLAGHVELIGIILIELTGQGAEGALGSEGELLPVWYWLMTV